MSDQACEVPLLELMASVPPKAILYWTDTEGLQASHSVPVGKYLHAAIGRIREREGSIVALEARVRELEAALQEAFSPDNSVRQRAWEFLQTLKKKP